MKQLLVGKEAKEKLLEGIKKLASAVEVTLGPDGKNVIIANSLDLPIITKDGATVAKNIDLSDSTEEVGALLLRQAATKTAKEVGDGTTTSTIIACNLIEQGLRLVEKTSYFDLFKTIDKIETELVEELSRVKEDIKDNFQKILEIATISANNNKELGRLIAEAFYKTNYGFVTLEESKNVDTTYKIVDGLEFDRGYTSSYFITDKGKMNCVLNNASILCIDHKLEDIRPFIPLLNYHSENKIPILIISQGYMEDFISQLVYNKIKGTINVCAVEGPAWSGRRAEIMEDIAIMCGGKLISKEAIQDLPTRWAEYIGMSNSVIVTKDSTKIFEGAGKEEDILQRIQELEERILAEPLQHFQSKLEERIGRMKNGACIIQVGGFSEMEAKEKYYLVEDAIHSTKAAIESGVVIGSANFLMKFYLKLKEKAENDPELQVVINSLAQPFLKLCDNSQIFTVDYNRLKDNDYIGLNIKTKKIEDLKTAGVIDPAKVIEVAVKNAFSVAKTVLSTACLINNKIE